MPDRRTSYWLWFCLLGALTLAPLWVGRYLPMVDLPQHAAQMAIRLHWDDPAPPSYPQIYQINPWMAHRLPYALVLILARALPLLTAIKVVVGAALIAGPWIVRRMIRDLGGDPWWSLATFPVGFGFAFYFGFFNFVVATPLAWAAIWLVYRFTARPGWSRAAAVAVAVHVLFFSHLLAMGFVGLAGGAIVLLGARRWRWRWLGWAALASVLPLVAAWYAVNTRPEAVSSAPVPSHWGLSAARLWKLPGEAVGMPEVAAAAVVGLVLLLAPLLAGGRPSRAVARWIPALLALAFYALGPQAFFGTALLSLRFAAWIVPGLVLAFEAPSTPTRWPRRLAVPVLTAVWLASLTPRFYVFNRDAEHLDDVLAHAEPGRRMLALIADPYAHMVPEAPFVHFGMWYQVEKKGVVDFSFAEFFANRYRYRPEHAPTLPLGIEWEPRLFRWSRHGGDRYGYFLVRARDPRVFERWNPFAGAPYPIAGVASAGSWYLFEPRPVPLRTLEGEGEEEGPQGTPVIVPSPEVVVP